MHGDGDGRRRPWGGALARVEAQGVLAASRAGRDLVAEFPEWFADLMPPVPLGALVAHVSRHATGPGPEPVRVLEVDGARVLVRSSGGTGSRRRWVWRRDLLLADTAALAAARAARVEDLLAAAAVVSASGQPVDLPAAPASPVPTTVDLRESARLARLVGLVGLVEGLPAAGAQAVRSG